MMFTNWMRIKKREGNKSNEIKCTNEIKKQNNKNNFKYV